MAIPGYKIIRKIGDGGMSSVYLAIQLSVGREVALKVLAPELRNDPAQGKKFFSEANTCGTLSHPNIISIYDVGNEGQFYYIAMDYLPSPSCADQIKKQAISNHQALRITRDIAGALDYLHSKGLAHCDVKPDNILFRHDGAGVLTDFGIATRIDTGKNPASRAIAGTPYYMSPEQFQAKHIDGRTDIYSLGIVLYEMLTGSVPFLGKEAVNVAVKHISTQVPDLPEHLIPYRSLLLKMLAKKPESRYQSGQELIEAIDKLTQNLNSGIERQSGLSTESTIIQVFSLKETLLAMSSVITRIVGQKCRDLLKGMRNTKVSLRYGLVIQNKIPLLKPDLSRLSDEETQEQLATIAQTTGFQESLGDALNANRARTIISAPVMFLFALLLSAGVVTMTIPFEQLKQMFNSANTETKNLIESVNESLSPHLPKDLSQLITLGEDDDTNAHNNPNSTLDAASMSKVRSPQADQEATNPTNRPIEMSTSKQGLTNSIAATKRQKTTENQQLTERSNTQSSKEKQIQNNAVPIKTIKRHALTVNTLPKGARVAILNIKPRYHKGIQLTPGRYHIKVSKSGYQSERRWIDLSTQDTVIGITLKKSAPKFKAGDTFSDSLKMSGVGPKVIVLPRQKSKLGQQDDDTNKPKRNYYPKKHFAIGSREITLAEYDKYTQNTNQLQVDPDENERDSLPVNEISWQEAQAYTRWLSQQTGQVYRLPTADEWEYAARAGTESRYYWGAQNASKRANCKAGCDSKWSGFFRGKPAPVGSFDANPWGLFDTAGNLAEWVAGCAVNNSKDTQTTGDRCSKRVTKGGSYKNKSRDIAPGLQQTEDAKERHQTIGFRVLREI
jgi:serine/threonine-protein kinase PpkA